MTWAGRRTYSLDTLMDVAVGVLNERGYDGTSMEDLAQALGITKSSIYHHVASKGALLELALDRALTALTAVLDEPGATTGPARDRLEHAVCRSVEVLDAELPYVTLLLRVRGNTAVEVAALERRREFDHHVAGLVAAAIAEGDLRDDLDPALVTRLLFGTVNSLVEWYRPGQGLGPDEVAATLTELVMRGLEPPARTGSRQDPVTDPRAAG